MGWRLKNCDGSRRRLHSTPSSLEQCHVIFTRRTDAPAGPRRRAVSRAAVGAVLGVLLTLAGLLTWLWLHRDRTPPLTVEALETARRRWEDSHVTDYDLDVQLSGQREGMIRTKVRGGVIVEHTNNGRTPA